MRMGKKTKVTLMTTLIAALCAFGASTYGIGKHSSLKSPEVSTYSINSEVLLSEDNEIINSIDAAKEETHVQEQQVAVAIPKSTEIKDKQVLSRGGSGLNQTKPKVQPKPAAKQSAKPAAASTSVQADNERDLFYRLVSAETSGEPFEGQLAVATVIINRVKSSQFANTITGVIMDKSWGYQFTPVLDGRINNTPTASAKKAVDMVLGGFRSFGPEVMWFVNPRKAESPWIVNNRTYYKTIGNHDFYR